MSIYKQSYPFAYAPASLAAVTSASHKSMFAAFNIDVNDFVLLNVTALSLWDELQFKYCLCRDLLKIFPAFLLLFVLIQRFDLVFNLFGFFLFIEAKKNVHMYIILSQADFSICIYLCRRRL